MTDAEPADITRLLWALEEGETGAADQLASVVYAQLHDLAVRALWREEPGLTLQPTALVHEAFMLLVGQRAPNWQGRTHFFSLASRLMRRILVDYARKRRAAKRGQGLRVVLDESIVSGRDDPADRTLDLIAIDDAMTRLASFDERPARVVELRFFGGFDVEETARALNVSVACVKRDWAFARAFLKRELSQGDAGT